VRTPFAKPWAVVTVAGGNAANFLQAQSTVNPSQRPAGAISLPSGPIIPAAWPWQGHTMAVSWVASVAAAFQVPSDPQNPSAEFPPTFH
jgi:hypothetical protein